MVKALRCYHGYPVQNNYLDPPKNAGLGLIGDCQTFIDIKIKIF